MISTSSIQEGSYKPFEIEMRSLKSYSTPRKLKSNTCRRPPLCPASHRRARSLSSIHIDSKSSKQMRNSRRGGTEKSEIGFIKSKRYKYSVDVIRLRELFDDSDSDHFNNHAACSSSKNSDHFVKRFKLRSDDDYEEERVSLQTIVRINWIKFVGELLVKVTKE